MLGNTDGDYAAGLKDFRTDGLRDLMNCLTDETKELRDCRTDATKD